MTKFPTLAALVVAAGILSGTTNAQSNTPPAKLPFVPAMELKLVKGDDNPLLPPTSSKKVVPVTPPALETPTPKLDETPAVPAVPAVPTVPTPALPTIPSVDLGTPPPATFLPPALETPKLTPAPLTLTPPVVADPPVVVEKAAPVPAVEEYKGPVSYPSGLRLEKNPKVVFVADMERLTKRPGAQLLVQFEKISPADPKRGEDALRTVMVRAYDDSEELIELEQQELLAVVKAPMSEKGVLLLKDVKCFVSLKADKDFGDVHPAIITGTKEGLVSINARGKDGLFYPRTVEAGSLMTMTAYAALKAPPTTAAVTPSTPAPTTKVAAPPAPQFTLNQQVYVDGRTNLVWTITADAGNGNVTVSATYQPAPTQCELNGRCQPQQPRTIQATLPLSRLQPVPTATR